MTTFVIICILAASFALIVLAILKICGSFTSTCSKICKYENLTTVEQGSVTKNGVTTSSYKATFGSHTCTHGPFGGRKVMTIKGKQVGIGVSPFCDKCTQEYFDKYSTFCDICGDVICPGMPVGQHYKRLSDGTEKLVTTCQKSSCAMPGNIVGHWEEGRISRMNWGSGKILHEPEIKPSTENCCVVTACQQKAEDKPITAEECQESLEACKESDIIVGCSCEQSEPTVFNDGFFVDPNLATSRIIEMDSHVSDSVLSALPNAKDSANSKYIMYDGRLS